MPEEVWKELKRISESSHPLDNLISYLKDNKPDTTRTEQQHKALFKWFSMIEKEAENAGVTWNMVVEHTHQLRITKEGLHGMFKTLQKALFNKKSTKELKKTGQLDIMIDHFVDLFSKVGLELPPFPVDEKKQREKIAPMQPLQVEYPESTGVPNI